jgi:hypothetical protein
MQIMEIAILSYGTEIANLQFHGRNIISRRGLPVIINNDNPTYWYPDLGALFLCTPAKTQDSDRNITDVPLNSESL